METWSSDQLPKCNETTLDFQQCTAMRIRFWALRTMVQEYGFVKGRWMWKRTACGFPVDAAPLFRDE